MTLLTIVNKVLRRLREDTVSSVAESEYSKLIGEFVNEAKEQMEDMWFWSVYETAVSTSILGDSATTDYDLTATNDRSFLIRRERDQLPMAFDVTSGDQAGQLFDMSYKDLRFKQSTLDGTDAVAIPSEFAVKPDADGRGYTIELVYPSSAARTWETHWYIPQDTLAVDASDDDTNILLPSVPLIAGAFLSALNERGEEMGEPGNVAERRFHRALAAAQELDMQVNKVSDQIDMTNLERLRNNLSEII
jgi:hypothetical protein